MTESTRTERAYERIVPLAQHESTGDGGYQATRVFRSDLVVVRIHGPIRDDEDVLRSTQLLNRALSEGEDIQIFFDLEGFSRYESAVRTRYTSALTPHLKRIRSVLVFSDSKLVRMGASVARMVIPVLSLVDEDEFMTALEAALATELSSSRF